jgi:hypothetical protein
MILNCEKYIHNFKDDGEGSRRKILNLFSRHSVVKHYNKRFIKGKMFVYIQVKYLYKLVFNLTGNISTVESFSIRNRRMRTKRIRLCVIRRIHT